MQMYIYHQKFFFYSRNHLLSFIDRSLNGFLYILFLVSLGHLKATFSSPPKSSYLVYLSFFGGCI
jgi:hypothetical protein